MEFVLCDVCKEKYEKALDGDIVPICSICWAKVAEMGKDSV